MVVQIDIENNAICHKWYNIEDIRKYTSYDLDKVKEAIKNREPYGECLWLEYNNNQ